MPGYARGHINAIFLLAVEYAVDIKDTETMGKQDPYCLVSVGQASTRTKTATDGGTKPGTSSRAMLHDITFHDQHLGVARSHLLWQPLAFALIGDW
jgi:hypothetical protein